MNIKFEYLYRDSGNFKNWGEVVFTNPKSIDVNILTKDIESALIEKLYFIAQTAMVPDSHFNDHDAKLDHDWHEFYAFHTTNEEPTDLKKRSVDEFLNSLTIAAHAF